MGFVTYTVQMVSAASYFPKAMFLEQLPLWEQWAESTFQNGGGGEEPLIAQVQLSVNWWLHPFNYFLQHLPVLAHLIINLNYY